MFEPYSGDLQGLAVTESHDVYRWKGPGKVLFSACKQGQSINAHFASDKSGLRYIKTAINDFVDFVFWLYDWCTMVIANVGRPSIGRVIEKVGFTPFAECEKGVFYMRPRDEFC